MSKLIIGIIDFFYPLFKRVMPLQTFRYAACGGFNTSLDIVLYFLSYNFLFDKQIVYIAGLAISAPIAAFLFSFCVTFPLGFYFSRYVVFTGSNLRGRIQLIRYFLMVLIAIGLNYICIKLLVERLAIYPTIAKIMTTGIVVSFSYLTQRYFTFGQSTLKVVGDEGETFQEEAESKSGV